MMQIFNLVRQPVQTYQVDRTDGTIPYGENNAFPLELATLVQESPAASSCISILSDFIEGNGFSDAELNTKIINGQKQTFGELHNLVAESYALFEGYCLLVKYSKSGAITEVFHVPFENVRLGVPDSSGVISKVKVNPYYGTALYQRKYTEEFDVYNPDPKVVLSQITKQGSKYKGQILYKAFTRPLSRFYPLPYYYSAKYWMDIDAQIGKYHAGNLDAGFFQTVLMRKIGDGNAPSMHPEDQETDSSGNKQSKRTLSERFNIDMQPFIGASSTTKMLVDWATSKDEATDIQPFPSLPNDAFFQTLQALTTKNILISTKIPSILANMGGEQSLSDGNQMANATRVMHDRVAKTQNMLEANYADILSHFATPYTKEVKIVNTNSFETLKEIDPLIWAEMTPDDRAVWIKKNTDYPVSPKPAGTPAPAAPMGFANILFTDYPAKARQNAKEAMRFMKDNPGCSKPAGRRMTQDIMDGKPLSFTDIRRIYNYLKRNREHENKIFSDSCDAVMYSGWGGTAMFEYCAEKITFINE